MSLETGGVLVDRAKKIGLRGTSKRYGSRTVLGPLDIDFSSGVTCVVGPNGAGKSTLFGVMGGLISPTTGTVEGESDRGRLGIMPQEPELPSRVRCGDFLEYAAWLQGVPRDERAHRAREALSAVDLSDTSAKRLGALSGGMRRRMALAQALVHDPSVLLLDEPTVGLDPLQRINAREAIAGVAKARTTLLATHLVDDVEALADRVVVLREGQVVFDGTTDDLKLLSRPEFPGSSDLERAIAGLFGA